MIKLRMVIGGLIVISLLTYSPAGGYTTFINKAISGNALIMLERGAKELQASINNEIDIVLGEMEANACKLSSSLKKKRIAVAMVEQAMRGLSEKSARLTEVQMNAYKSYSDMLQMKEYNIAANLNKLEASQELLPVKNELISKDTDYVYVYNELAGIATLQKETTGLLNIVSAAANDILELLETNDNC